MHVFPRKRVIAIISRGVINYTLSVVIGCSSIGGSRACTRIANGRAFGARGPGNGVLCNVRIFVRPRCHNLHLTHHVCRCHGRLYRALGLGTVVFNKHVPGCCGCTSRVHPGRCVSGIGRGRVFSPILAFRLSGSFRIHGIVHGCLPGSRRSGRCTYLLR